MSAQAPKEQRSRMISSYFPLKTGPQSSSHEKRPTEKMVAETSEMEVGESAARKTDIHRLEVAIIDKLSNRLSPLIKLLENQLESIKAAQIETKKDCCAMDLALTDQDSTRILQYGQDIMKQKMLTMDMDSRIFNVKLRGIPEKAEASTDLQIFISNWMASVMNMEDKITPCLTRARKIGVPVNPKRKGPRDILVSFLYMRDKYTLMREARQQGSFRFENECVEVYQDLPAEALTLRRELKPITHQLQVASRKYRCIGPAKIQVMHNWNPITANDLESVLLLLNMIRIKAPSDDSQKNSKRKLDIPATTPKGNKIPI